MLTSDKHREIVAGPAELEEQLKKRTRRGFLAGGVAAALGVGGFEWLRHAGQENGVPWPQRRMLDLNQKIAHSYLSDGHHMPTYKASQITYLKPNGDVGLGPDFNPASWNLHVMADGHPPLKLTLADVMSLPKVEMVTRFCCIEGWSVVTSWGGARFSDFTKKYLPAGQPMPHYVSMTTPDEEYYVGLDAKSALHPQTLLAYEHNGKPLTADHGAPLRLAIPVKYGIKNIKRIAAIQYTNDKPDDYWAEQGYDWFAGL